MATAGEIPEHLFHYTSQEGFLGIVRTKSLWATSIYYLNDSTEHAHAVGLARSVAGEMMEGVDTPTRAFLQQLVSQVDSVERESSNIFVCCFSEDGDQLGQWRGYCQSASGLSLGFTPEQLRQLGRSQHLLPNLGFHLVRCEYDPKAQREAIRALFSESLERFRTDPSWSAHSAWAFALGLARLAPTLKHEAFGQEREWRLVSEPVPIDHSRILFRPGRSMVLPYYDFSLVPFNTRLSIPKIVVGPTPHPELARRSVRSLLIREEVEWDELRDSTCPLRNW